ncbi:MAG: phosphoribosylglycinamide formyltransferase [Pseudomonadota bacterium]
MASRLPVAVLLSGRGSNFEALAAAAPTGGYEIRGVVSDRPAAAGLERARERGVAAHALPPGHYPDRAAHDAALAARIDALEPGLVVLAGYMRILSPPFVARYAGRLLNIHPSLLPKYPGLHTHRRVLEAGDPEHGATVHFVTDQLDGGPPIAQARVPVLAGDTVETLSARVQGAEHRLYPAVVGWFAAGRLAWRDGCAWLDGRVLQAPVQVEDTDGSGGADRAS